MHQDALPDETHELLCLQKCFLGACAVKAKQPQPKQGEDFPRTRQRDTTRLAFHSDQGATDLIALLSLTNAKSGGESKWVSGLAIHNELLRRGRKVCFASFSSSCWEKTCACIAGCCCVWECACHQSSASFFHPCLHALRPAKLLPWQHGAVHC